MHLRLVWITVVEVLVQILMNEQNEWVKVLDEWHVMLTTRLTFTTT